MSGFLNNKPIDREKGTICSCGRRATVLSPSVKDGRVKWTPRCGDCTGNNKKGK